MPFAIIACALIAFTCGYVYRWRGIPFLGKWRTPFVGRTARFAIGVYTGSSPKGLLPAEGAAHPVLSREAVTDVRALGVADPFLLRRNDKWFMFMEVVNRARRRGEIGLATSLDGYEWLYQSVVLREPFHLSYPCVFEHQGETWMVPETRADRSVRLYRAVDFPTRWRLEKRLLEGSPFSDPTVFHYQESWWMFVSRNCCEDLLLYFADEVTGPWRVHPQSPVIYAQPEKARCAGRPIQMNGELIRVAQDCGKKYGQSVRAFRVDRLNRRDYEESELQESPLLRGAKDGWNADGMHHIDLCTRADGSYLAAVDGWSLVRTIGLKF